MSKRRQKSYKFGLWAEYLVCLYFWVQGYRVLAMRYNTKVGEVDLIVKRGRYIIFTEVKYRKVLEDGLYAVQEKNKQRIMRAAQLFIQQQPDYLDCDLRFDLICVIPPFWIKHIPNAWQG